MSASLVMAACAADNTSVAPVGYFARELKLKAMSSTVVGVKRIGLAHRYVYNIDSTSK